VKTAEGRKQLIAILKDFENGEERRSATATGYGSTGCARNSGWNPKLIRPYTEPRL